jgi:hypothetical protein
MKAKQKAYRRNKNMGKTHDEPRSRNEAILQNILCEENELLEPQSRIEALLHEILEQGGTGGGSDGFSGLDVFELEEIDDSSVYGKITFSDKNYFSDVNLRGQPFIVQKRSMYVLCIPYPYAYDGDGAAISVDVAIIQNARLYMYRILRVSNKTYYFQDSHGNNADPTLYSGEETYLLSPYNDKENNGVISCYNNQLEWIPLETLFKRNGMSFDAVTFFDISNAESTFNTIVSAMKMYADATPNEIVTKYVPLTGEMQVSIYFLIEQIHRAISDSKVCPAIKINDTISLVPIVCNGSFVTWKYEECDFTNNKIYDLTFTAGTEKMIVQCTCYEATALS